MIGTEKTTARHGDEEALVDARPSIESRQRSWCYSHREKESGKESGEQQVRSPRHNRYGRGKLLAMLALAAFALLVFALQGAAVYLAVWKVRGGFDNVPGESTTNNTVQVNLTYATYQGTRVGNGVNAFLGMRYAAAPLGDLRWRAPIEPIRSTGVEKATEFRPICLASNGAYPQAGQDEDCLFVNVWAPANATARSKLPVWVFIQGGGYNALTNANWNGSELIEKSGHNLILVNFNYRVGIWGFLASERVRNDGALNAGLLDQRMLLKWVKRHISSFGGNPDHIVIHGASAGAGSVAMHLVSYGGRDDGLFVGGMVEAIFFPAQPFLSELEWQFDRVAAQAGCGKVDSDKQMACLRQKDVALLQRASRAQPFPGKTLPPNPIFYFTPCVDGDILRDIPYKSFETGQFIKVPMLFGTSNDEGSVFAANASTRSDMATFFENNYPRLTKNDTYSILARYPVLPSVPNHAPWFPTTSQAYGDATFICPQTNVLNYLSRRTYSSPSTNSPLYAYRFNVQDERNIATGMGVPHLFDAAAIFGPDNISGDVAHSYRTYNKEVVPRVMAYYISFARALDPNRYRLLGTPKWETWDSGQIGDMKRMLFETGNTQMELLSEEEKDRCRFWEVLGRERMEQR